MNKIPSDPADARIVLHRDVAMRADYAREKERKNRESTENPP
jgi:hypothetical protein